MTNAHRPCGMLRAAAGRLRYDSRMKLSWIVRALAPLVAALVGGTASAQSPPPLVDISACVAIESALARLDCYDGLARAAGEQPAAAAARATEAPTAAPARNQAPPASRSEANEPAALEELASEVSALREVLPGRLEIELANGQIWRQTSSDRYRLVVGQEVRVYRARAADRYFRLTAPTLRGFVQVERIR